MPEQYLADTPISKLHAGDVIRDWWFSSRDDRPVGKIAYLSAKSKFTYFRVEGGSREYRFANDCMTKVERERLTRDEERARQRERALESYDTQEQLAWRQLADARDDVLKAISAQRSLDPWVYDRLLEREARWAPYERVQRIHKSTSEMIAFDGKIEVKDASGTSIVETVTEVTRWTVLDRVVERLQEQVMNDLRFGSRSSSSIHNLHKDYELQACADFINEATGVFGTFNRHPYYE